MSVEERVFGPDYSYGDSDVPVEDWTWPSVGGPGMVVTSIDYYVDDGS